VKQILKQHLLRAQKINNRKKWFLKRKNFNVFWEESVWYLYLVFSLKYSHIIVSSCGPEVKYGHSIKFKKFSDVNLDPGFFMTDKETHLQLFFLKWRYFITRIQGFDDQNWKKLQLKNFIFCR
jgi:hypothetical protein